MSVVLAHARAKSEVDLETLRPLAFYSQKGYEAAAKSLGLLQDFYREKGSLSYHELSRPEQIKQAYEHLASVIKRGGSEMLSSEVFGHSLSIYSLFEMPGGVSNVMVLPILELLGSDEQRARWIPLLKSYRVVGAYTQTELGHGSDVQSLQTTATFIPETQEFELDSPCLEATKWWPGELANLASVAVVFAQVVSKGRKVAVMPLLVQLRDLETHKPLPGIEVGDIGPKFGYMAKENGFLRFNKLRVPKSALLNRFTDIDERGDLQLLGDPKIVYSAMMKVRLMLLANSGTVMGRVSASTLRYSFKRLQFRDSKGAEVPVIDYQLQRARLFPVLAQAYAISLAFIEVKAFVEQMDRETNEGVFSKLQEAHIFLSGGKAFYTSWCMKGLMTCMQCSGGHGYSVYSGIPHVMYGAFSMTILEGENTMIALQVGRFVLKQFHRLRSGEDSKTKGQTSYLSLEQGVYEPLSALLGNEKIVRIFQKTTLRLCQELLRSLGEDDPLSKIDQLNTQLGNKLFELSKFHTLVFTTELAFRSLQSVPHLPTKNALTNLLSLFAVEAALENSALMVVAKVLAPKDLLLLRQSREELLDALHYDSLILAEAFDIGKGSLLSVIGDDNDDQYQNLLDSAKKFGLLNQSKEFLIEKYFEHIRKTSLALFPDVKL